MKLLALSLALSPGSCGAGRGGTGTVAEAGKAAGAQETALQPIWSVAGYALGAATALLGPEAAMACTAAIETEIDRHYTQQLDELADGSDPELAAVVEEFRDDEREHLHTALVSGAERAPAYPLLSGAIRLGCRVAIRLSERI